jgi:hypothetical protein
MPPRTQRHAQCPEQADARATTTEGGDLPRRHRPTPARATLEPYSLISAGDGPTAHREGNVPDEAGGVPLLMAKVGKSDGEGTFAGPRGNDKVAPRPAVRGAAIERQGSTLMYGPAAVRK